MTDPVTYDEVFDTLGAIVADRPPWSIDAVDWCVSRGLIVKCRMPPPSEFEYYELTNVGSRLYHNTIAHFTRVLDAHHESGQLRESIDPYLDLIEAKLNEGSTTNGTKVHDNTNEQDTEARDVTGLTQQETATFIAEGTVSIGRGTHGNVRRGNRRKSKG